MRDRSKNREIDPRIEKALLSLHAALDLEALWKAIQRVINESMADSVIGLTLQHNPVFPLIEKWSRSIRDGFFNTKPLQVYLRAHPRSRFVRICDVFPVGSKLLKSDFYSKYMKSRGCRYGIGLFFWNTHQLIAVIIVMRTTKQGELTEQQLALLRYFYPQFQTALHRLHSLEHEHFAQAAFEEFLGRLPLPTILLQWNLKPVYRNKAALEFCTLWKQGPEMARVMKAIAPVPSDLLDGCRVLKRRWECVSRGRELGSAVRREVVRNQKWPHLRATLGLRQLGSASIARPHFLIECEDLAPPKKPTAPLAHLARLTRREQQVARLVCDGQSNQEIADQIASSVAMVKKHLHTIFGKLEVTSRSRLMALMR